MTARHTHYRRMQLARWLFKQGATYIVEVTRVAPGFLVARDRNVVNANANAVGGSFSCRTYGAKDENTREACLGAALCESAITCMLRRNHLN